MGPNASFEAYRKFFTERLLDTSEGHRNAVLALETHGTTARIQSFEYMMYNTLHRDRENRAHLPPTSYFFAHIAVSVTLTMAVLLFIRQRSDAIGETLFFSVLVLLAVPISPVSRPHYYALASIAWAGLLAAEWPRHRGLWAGWPVMLAGFASFATGLLVALNQHQSVDFGLATYASLALSIVALGCAQCRRRWIRVT